MKKLFLLFIGIGLLQISQLQAVEIKVNLAQASLSDAVGATPPSEVISLVITGGVINSDVFSFIRSKLTNLQRLDMSGATVIENMIPSSVFSYFWQLTVVAFPKNVTSIGDGAFINTGLTSVTIPATVTSIGKSAFSGCTGLTAVQIPPSVKSIGDAAFSGCTELKSIVIPEGITNIENYTFSGTGLITITIPASVMSIGNDVFAGCVNLTAIRTAPGNTAFRSDDGVLFNAGMTQLLVYPAGKTGTSYTVPATVTSIAPNAFAGCRYLTELVTGNTAYRSEAGVLFNADKTQLLLYPPGKAGTSYTIPNGVKSIGINAFRGCSKLTTVNFPLGMAHIGDGAFYGCTGLTGVSFPIFVESIGNSAFSNCTGISNLYIPPSVTSIGNSAFSGCSGISDVFIPASVKSFGTGVFSGCTDLGLAMISNGLTTIPNYTFSGCSRLTNITLPSSVKSIGNSAFSGCAGLIDFIIPPSVTNIGEFAFFGCFNLTSITIPPSVTDIGNAAFWDCTGLTSIMIPPSVSSWGTGVFRGCTGLVAAEISEGISNIPASSFNGCSGLTAVRIPETVTSIGVMAFYNCTGLRSVTIPASVSSINGGAFQGCSNLASIYAYPLQPPAVMEAFDRNKCTLYVPGISLGSYWSAFWERRTFIDIRSMDSPWQLELDKSEIRLKTGGSEILTATVIPEEADQTVRWISDRPDIATVDISGKVTGLRTGGVSILAASTLENVWVDCFVIVTDEKAVTRVLLNKTVAYMLVGDTEQLSSYIEPSDASVQTIKWTTDDADVATVNGTGKITAVGEGITFVTAASADGAKSICRVNVDLAAPDIKLNKKEMNLPVGSNQQLTATVTPENAPDKSVVWITDHPEIAEVDASGKVTGISQGTAVITAFIKTGNKRAICMVTVGETTGLEIADAPLARMYPNPTEGLFTLGFESPGIYHITITTVTGKVLLRQTVSDQVKQMDISNYPAGVYMLVIDDGKRQSTTKIVKR